MPGAQQYQRDFYAETDRWLPIIILTLPTTTAGDATFVYRSADQAFFPGGPLSIDRTPLALDGFRIFASWPATGVEVPGNTAIRRAVGGTPPYRYTSSNTQVATVSGNGQVTEHGGVCPAGYYTYYHAENTQALACALPGESSVTGALYVVPY